MRSIGRSFLAVVLATGLPLLACAAAQAQINGPTPPLMGQPSFHLYSVPGVMHVGFLETFYACTNTTSANIRVAVETFGSFGGAAINDPSATSLDLLPGATRIFANIPAVGFVVDSTLGAGPISRGSARILATARSGIICSAFLADPGNAPPTTMADLTIVKKRTQKGD